MRTNAHTDPTTLAGRGIDATDVSAWGDLDRRDGVEAAMLPAQSAAQAVLCTDHGLVAAAEFVLLPHLRRQHQMQVGGIDVAIGKHGVVGEHGKAGEHAGLARAALSADDDEFVHAFTR